MILLPLLPSGGISTRRLILAALGVGALVLGLCGWSCAAEHRSNAHTAKADTHQTARVVAAAEGAVYDQTAEAQAKDNAARAAEVARLKAEVARLRATPRPAEPVGMPAPELDLSALVEAQGALLQAQDHEIGGLKAELETVKKARDSWKRSAEEGGREALQLRAALAAREGSLRAERWKGRIEGLAVGFALGYGTGRLQ